MGAGSSVVEEARRIGNEAFSERNYAKAVEAYTRALDVR